MRLVMLVAMLMAMVAGLSLCGCDGDCDNGDDGFIVPAALIGFWGAVALDQADRPVGGELLEVDANGDILIGDEVVGELSGPGGNFTASFPDGDGGTVNINGDLDTNDTGTGTFTQGAESGSVELLRASYSTPFTMNVTVAGDGTGTGTISGDADGFLTGSITSDSITWDVNGVVTTNGRVAGGGEVAEGVFVLFRGNLTATGGSGTWIASDGSTGTWTGTF